MINGLGVLGWGVGGIEAEAAMLGQPIALPQPIVVGVRLRGALPSGTTATDLVLTLTQMLRSHGVVGRFVEFTGDGLSTLPIADRATLANMCPEYGATSAYFPVDDQTLTYLRFTGRVAAADLTERYAREQGLFRVDGAPEARSSPRSRDRSGRRTGSPCPTSGAPSSPRSTTMSCRTRTLRRSGASWRKGGRRASIICQAETICPTRR
jgi:hypothetical protein